jgi:hypothetical protein
MRARVCVVVGCGLGAIATWSSAAAANGRFPGARQVALAPALSPVGSPLVLRTTFGQMVSNDGGATFHWLCEEQIGYGGTQDPAVGITADGTLLNAAYEGTSLSHDGGCTFPFVKELDGVYSVDLTVDRTNPAHALVVVAAAPDQGRPLGELFESFDDGRSWSARATFPQGFFPQNVDVAPSDPARLYLTGPLLRPGASAAAQTLLRSEDGGASFVERAVVVAGNVETRNVYLSAVHPQLVNRIYVRAEGAGEEPDRLLVSDDAGESFREALALPGGMLGFALSPDGTRLAVGGPVAGVWVGPSEAGVGTLSQRSTTPVTCLAWGGDGLYACGLDETTSGFALGRSSDEGATFGPLLRALGDVCGPRTDCSANSSYVAICPPRWPAVRETLATSATGRPPACDGKAGSVSSGGSAGVSATAGAGAGGVDAASTPGAAPPSDGSSSCACRIGSRGGADRSSRAWLLALGATCALARRRARRFREVS